MFQVPHHDILKYGISLNSRKLSVYAGGIEEYYAFYYRWSLPDVKGANGFEFAKAVNQIKPEIKILLMTRFDIDTLLKMNLEYIKNLGGIIQNPVSSAKLARMIMAQIRVQCFLILIEDSKRYR